MTIMTRIFKREKYRRVVDALLLITGAALLCVTFRAVYILWWAFFS